MKWLDKQVTQSLKFALLPLTLSLRKTKHTCSNNLVMLVLKDSGHAVQMKVLVCGRCLDGICGITCWRRFMFRAYWNMAGSSQCVVSCLALHSFVFSSKLWIPHQDIYFGNGTVIFSPATLFYLLYVMGALQFLTNGSKRKKNQAAKSAELLGSLVKAPKDNKMWGPKVLELARLLSWKVDAQCVWPRPLDLVQYLGLVKIWGLKHLSNVDPKRD